MCSAKSPASGGIATVLGVMNPGPRNYPEIYTWVDTFEPVFVWTRIIASSCSSW